MKVYELVQILSKVNQDAEVTVEVGNNDGCDTCGHGETSSEHGIREANDLETRIVLVPKSY